jgi:cob(I)alamin adenosyltransferase
VGVAIAARDGAPLPVLEQVQRMLFEIGSGLATPPGHGKKALSATGATDDDVAALEAAIDTADEKLAPLQAFVLPGGTGAAAAFHVARTVCRRAERRVVALHREEPLADATIRYLNRLSDLLFVLARAENQRADVGDVEWTRRGG